MAIDTRRARRALRAAGLRGPALLGAMWPLGQDRRLHDALRRRLAVLEAKNAVVDLLSRLQRPVAELQLSSLPQVRELLEDSKKRRLLLGVTPSRTVMEEELSRTTGIELGPTLELALQELIAERVVLLIPARDVLSHESVYLLLPHVDRPHWDTSELRKLTREEGTRAEQLQQRERRRSTTDGSRSYDL